MKQAFQLGCAGIILLSGLYLLTAPLWAEEKQVSLEKAKDCHSAYHLADDFAKDVYSGMVPIPAGSFQPGSDEGYPDETPSGTVQVKTFWMDKTEVTNEQFAIFVKETQYKTEAEKEGGAVVFIRPEKDVDIAYNSWWKYVEGANWRHPKGPKSTIMGWGDLPVILLTYKDALAYAQWLGRDLPTESEWEWAAMGGQDKASSNLEPRTFDGTFLANYWQGVFPTENTHEDGFERVAPVGCFPENGYGLQDMIGNVWEWTKDDYTGEREFHNNGEPELVFEKDAKQVQGKSKVIKGGSYLCAPNYCVRYRSAARHPQETNLGVSHVGFRTVLRPITQ